MGPQRLADNGLLGFIGLGAMGGRMARNLCRADYSVLGYDLDQVRVRECAETGVVEASGPVQIATECDIVLTSVRSSEAWVALMEEHLVPRARGGQTFVDLGTVAPPQTRRVGAALAGKGAALVDAPVSGGPGGAETGTLRIFVGGDAEVFERVRPILEVLGDSARIVHCGPCGAGQVVKGCNQVAMGVADAAYMEALSFGVAQGIDPQAIIQGVGGDEGWRGHFAALATRIAAGHEDGRETKYPELPYYLEESNEQGLEMPLMRALYRYGLGFPNDKLDCMGRPTIAFWPAVLRRR
jgi:3-hydroxyisobutyrate dehydrogenase-like beta-hydroxyacid dehydrogenase